MAVCRSCSTDIPWKSFARISIRSCLSFQVDKTSRHNHNRIDCYAELLQTLQDCGTPYLATRAPTLRQPTELRTSDRKSLFAYMGLPLDIFGEVSFLLGLETDRFMGFI